MKKVFAVVLVVVLMATMIGTATTALANPKGMRDADLGFDVGQMLYKFNIIAIPHDDWGGDITNSGRRIFVTRNFDGPGGERLAKITWDADLGHTAFRISDCDATVAGGKEATIDSPMNIDVVVGLRMHGKGKPGMEDEINLKCINPIIDPDDRRMICAFETMKIKKSDGFIKVMDGWFADEAEDVWWELLKVNGKQFRACEVRVYEILSR